MDNILRFPTTLSESAPTAPPTLPRYAELQVTSNYSFLRGASHPEELLAAAKLLGHEGLAITDRNTLAGVLRSHGRAAELNTRLVIGCRLDLRDGTSLLVYPTDRSAYSRLCRLLTAGKAKAGKGACFLDWQDVVAHAEGLLAILLPGEEDDTTQANLRRLHQSFGDRAHVALTLHRRPGDAVRLHRIVEMAQTSHVAPVVTGDVLYHAPDRRVLQNVMSCIREGCTIDAAGHRLERFADRHLRAPGEMARLFAAYPEAVARTVEIVERCRFSLSELRYQYPNETELPGETAQQALERHTWSSLPNRYAAGTPPEVLTQLRHELQLIGQLNYAPYFLTVNTIVRQARAMGILCQGRGSAANSAVCYVLGITAINPVESSLLFERFVSAERHEPPDIDVDFEHERREEIIQWIYEHYGRDRAALCATVVRYRSRGAVREVGKVMGLTEDVTAALASQVWGWSEDGVEEKHADQLNLNLADRRLRLTLDIARELIGHPRHLSQHPGGFVLTQDQLADLVPIEPASMKDRQVIEWDKDDIDLLKFMKVDILGLGMLGCMRRSFDLLEQHRGIRHDIASIPQDDKPTYAMIQKADTLGTFQIESRAQMSMLPRHKPARLYDLTIQVAVVRPGPIQGDMVHPYLRRRAGLEKPEYPHPELERVLGKTLGVPLFQEQAMQVAIVCAGFTPGEADQLRRAMATFKQTGGVSHFRDKMINGMVARHYTAEFAARTFKQIEGFGSYGFPESHAASFALIAYASSWMKCHHPDVFCAALLNAQPMGFYAPAQVVRDAREHGVEIRPVCVNASVWDCTLEDSDGRFMAVRMGLRMAKGLVQAHADAVIGRRGDGYRSVAEVWQLAAVPLAALERLAEADAFASVGADRRMALWAIRGLGEPPPPLLALCNDVSLSRSSRERAGVRAALPLAPSVSHLSHPHPGPLPPAVEGEESKGSQHTEPVVVLAPMAEGREVVEDYQSTGLSLRRHPVTFLRKDLRARGMITCATLAATKDGRRVTVPGIVLVRQKPGSAKGVMFITIEDETGIANLVLWPSLFEKQRRLVLSAGMIACRGRVQREGEVVHVVVEHLIDLSQELRSVGNRSLPFPIERGRGDGATHPGSADSREQVAAAGWRTRDIYVPDGRFSNGHIKVPTRDFR
jgi:error-prone DNA polymerase